MGWTDNDWPIAVARAPAAPAGATTPPGKRVIERGRIGQAVIVARDDVGGLGEAFLDSVRVWKR